MSTTIYADSLTNPQVLSQSADAFRLEISNNWRESTGYSFVINGRRYTWSQNNSNSSSPIFASSVAKLMASRLNQVYGDIATFTDYNGVVLANVKDNKKCSVSVDLNLGFGPADQSITAYVSTGTSQLGNFKAENNQPKEGYMLYAPDLSTDPEGFAGNNFVYQWYKNNQKISDSNSSILIPKDGAAVYKVSVSYLDKQGFASTLQSYEFDIVPFNNGNAAIGSITSSRSGIFTEGVTLFAPSIEGDPDGDSPEPNFSYQWFKDGAPVENALSSTYTVPRNGRGLYTVSVTYTDKQNFRQTLATESVKVVRSILEPNDVLVSNNLIRVSFKDNIIVSGSTVLNREQLKLVVDGLDRSFSAINFGTNFIDFIVAGRSLETAKSISLNYSRLLNGATKGFLSDLSGNELDYFTLGNEFTFLAKGNVSKSGLSQIYRKLILDPTVSNGYGNSLNNEIIGNASDNFLDGLTGSDTLIGGLGNDTYVVDNIGDLVVEQSSQGIDTVNSYISYILGENLENLILLGSNKLSATGNENANKIDGNNADNLIYGMGGNDILIGNGGDDLLFGGTGADSMQGGLGDDTYYVDQVDDVISEATGGGRDLVISSISLTLADQVENLQLVESDAITGVGNKLDNIIYGNNNDNMIDGNGGRDILTGGLGADTFRISTIPSYGISKSARITDFSSTNDTLLINRSRLGLLSDTDLTFLSVSSSTALSDALKTSTIFIYDTSSGALYYNQNGTGLGFGTGGVFALLDSKPFISLNNIKVY